MFVLTASMNNLTMYLSFKLHQAEIAEIFCINKNKPSLHCEGKCYLNERLAKTNEKENPAAPLTKFEETLRINFFLPISAALKVEFTATQSRCCFEYLVLNSQPFHHSFFQPPESQLLAS